MEVMLVLIILGIAYLTMLTVKSVVKAKHTIQTYNRSLGKRSKTPIEPQRETQSLSSVFPMEDSEDVFEDWREWEE